MKTYSKLQQQIAVEAARLMTEAGIDSISTARKKAALKLGIHQEQSLPDDAAILQALETQQFLYQSTATKEQLDEIRRTALNAMQLFHDFQPRLIGSVLQGFAQHHSSIDLLLNVDSPEEIATFLIDKNIPSQLQEWPVFFSKAGRHSKKIPVFVPAYQFYAGNQPVNLIILDEHQQKRTLFDAAGGQVLKKASIAQVQDLSG